MVMTLPLLGRLTRTRNRTGIARIFLRHMRRGERLTLDQAIELLKAKW